MDVKSLHFQSVACPRMRTLVLQTMDFQSIVVDYDIFPARLLKPSLKQIIAFWKGHLADKRSPVQRLWDGLMFNPFTFAANPPPFPMQLQFRSVDTSFLSRTECTVPRSGPVLFGYQPGGVFSHLRELCVREYPLGGDFDLYGKPNTAGLVHKAPGISIAGG